MNYSSQISQLLLSGEVICAYSHPSFFQRLVQNDELLVKIETTLLSLERRLIQSASGNTFYAVNSTLDDKEKSEAKIYFKYIVHDARYILSWLDFFAEVSQQDIYIQAGDKINFSDTVNALTYNQSLQEKLRSILKVSSNIDVVQLAEKLFDRLQKKDKVMILVDRHKRQYQFTGKLELIQQSLLFIVEQNLLYQDEPAEELQEQRGML